MPLKISSTVFPTTPDLFEPVTTGMRERLGEQAWVLRGFALADAPALISAVDTIERTAPFRHMVTPGGFTMSVALTNCGTLGWTTDRSGYRYTRTDPLSGLPWPAMPQVFLGLAQRAAAEAGFQDFCPDACLVNRYLPGARLSLHQDRNELGLDAPIVSVSLGIRATFLFGTHNRSDRAVRILLSHGDVVVWGGVDRMRFHGVLPLKEATHPELGTQRVNLTFRRAG